MRRSSSYANYSMDAEGQRMVARRLEREKYLKRTGVGYSVEMQIALLVARHRREVGKVPVTLPRVMWLERPEID